jgi:TPR repeat protein
MYELAVALYTGDGVPENTELAVRIFVRSANLGHAGAAYMLGECLLDGVGVERDRASALEWLVTAAELGHQLARKRVFVILQQDYDKLDSGQAEMEEREDETKKWVNGVHEDTVRDVNIERRFTVGGGSRNPHVRARRNTKVQESRDTP